MVRMPKKFNACREPLSSYTHFIGAVLFGLGGIGLLAKGFADQVSALNMAGLWIFVISLALLYNTSWVYHFVDLTPAAVLRWRKTDHSMIYVLIAGTYTPMCFHFYGGSQGMVFALVMWAIAAVGIWLKLCWFNAPRWVSTGFYIVMGWAVIFNVKPIFLAGIMPFLLLLAGGLAYTIGGVIYALKKPDLSAYIGFHELFHLFVILGSLCHFLLVWFYIA